MIRHFHDITYKSRFFGSHLLFPSGPFEFILDKENIFMMVEEIMTEIESKITGIRTDYKLTEQQRKDLSEILSIQEENYNLNYASMSMNEQRERITHFLFRFSEIAFSEKKNPIEIFVEGLSRLFPDPSPDNFTYKTRFIHYRDALYALVEKIFSEGHISKMQGLRKFISQDEAFAALQHIRKINAEAFDYLDEIQNKELSKDIIDRCISIYNDLSGSIEKYVRLLVFISKTIEGIKADYTQIKKDSLANHVGYLKKRPFTKDLVRNIYVSNMNFFYRDILYIYRTRSIGIYLV